MATETTLVTDAAEHAAPKVGMPQLDFSTFPNQIFWLVVTLVAIYLILSRVALPRIASVLAERQGTITNDIAAAEELKRKAEDAETSYNQALADARTEAQKIVAAAKEDIQAELDVARAKADAEIGARASESEKAIAEIRATAIDNVRKVALATAGDIVAALGSSSADTATIDAAVNAQMKG